MIHHYPQESVNVADREYAKWWLEMSNPFRQLKTRHSDIQNGIMTFEQFLEMVLIHLDNTDETKYNRRWSQIWSGESHINPIYAILQPCHYPFKYCKWLLRTIGIFIEYLIDLKVENMSKESRQLFQAISMELPSDYLLPNHQSETSSELPEDRVKGYYRNIPVEMRSRLKTHYQIDLDFFEYTIDINTLEITY